MGESSSGAGARTFWAIPQGGLVAVRGRVKDSAGNEAQSQYQVDISPVGSLTPAANTPSPVGVPDFSAPVASGQNPLLSRVPTVGTNPMLGALPPRPTNSYSDNGYTDNGYTGNGYASNSALPFPGNSATQPLATPSPFGPAVTGPAPGTGVGGVPGPGGNTPQWQQQNVSSIPGTGNPSQIPAYELPAPVGHRIVKSRQFSIDYRIDDIGD